MKALLFCCDQSSREDEVAPCSRAGRRLPSGNVFLSATLCIKINHRTEPVVYIYPLYCLISDSSASYSVCSTAWRLRT